GSIADTVLINDNAIKLRDYYEQEGYGLVEVTPVLDYISSSEVSLTYLIKEGPKVKIKEIDFEGNKAFSAGKLRKTVKSSARGFFSFITKSGYYKRADALGDAELVKDLYYNNGYIQATVSEPVIKFSSDKKWVTVLYRINEGPQFKVSSVEFEGNKVYTAAELKKVLKTKVGEPVDRQAIRDEVVALTEKYAEKGYALAGISPEIVPDTAKKTAAVIYHVEEGDIYHIGRIEITGNVKTRDVVIRREVLLSEGDIFNSQLLKKSYQRINNLNFFENVSLEPQPVPGKKLVNLDINVKERPTGFLSVGGGYSSIDKLIGMVDLSQGNLGGRGQYVKLSAELGGSSSLYEFTFKEPWLFGRKLAFSASVYKQDRQYLDYTRKATGLELGLSKNVINDDTWVSATYTLEQADITDVLATASPEVKDQLGQRLTSSITPGIVRDTRDNYLDPHTGSRNSASITFAGLGGDNKFYKLILESAWFLPVSENTTVSLRGTYGMANGIFGQPLPLYERFYVGGIYTIRGLGYGEGGPRDSNGEPIGGKNELVLNADYIFPLLPAIKLKGVVFVDGGTAYDGMTPSNFRYTAGTGIRWISPMGPIRLEWGYNLNKKADEKSSRFEFAFGTFF
ncbi:MAG: outer membrane protein assembly factor BamA, partial [Nitrospiraceae bacterium]|nr:outer membrane protein assembly factor BamA [Nitrospiraceae bacterium]